MERCVKCVDVLTAREIQKKTSAIRRVTHTKIADCCFDKERQSV